MPARQVRSIRIWCVLFVCLSPVGCGKKGPSTEPLTPTEENLETIGEAYTRATIRLNRPPENLNDLLPSLREGRGKPDELLRSPNDGENFEIVWGVELRMLKAKGNDIPVIAYEKKGKGGKRHVLRGRSGLLVLTETELRSAKFPEGYKLSF